MTRVAVAVVFLALIACSNAPKKPDYVVEGGLPQIVAATQAGAKQRCGDKWADTKTGGFCSSIAHADMQNLSLAERAEIQLSKDGVRTVYVWARLDENNDRTGLVRGDGKPETKSEVLCLTVLHRSLPGINYVSVKSLTDWNLALCKK